MQADYEGFLYGKASAYTVEGAGLSAAFSAAVERSEKYSGGRSVIVKAGSKISEKS